MNIIIFDGASGTGKTTLRYKLFEVLNYDVLTIDRFTPSVWVYDRLRGIDREDVLDFESIFNLLNPLVIICECDISTIQNRIRICSSGRRKFEIKDELETFKAYIKVSRYTNLITLDTSPSVDSCIHKIREHL